MKRILIIFLCFVLLSGCAVLHAARRLDNYVGANLAPGKICSLARLECLDLVAIDNDSALFCIAFIKDAPLAGIVFHQIGRTVKIAWIVDGNNLDIRVLLSDSKNETTDTAKAIDTDFDRHPRDSSFLKVVPDAPQYSGVERLRISAVRQTGCYIRAIWLRLARKSQARRDG